MVPNKFDTEYYQKLESDIAQLLEAVERTKSNKINECSEYLDVGEYGLAFETLCEAVSNEAIQVPLETRQMFRVLGELMGIDDVYWIEISDGPAVSHSK